MNIQEGLTPSHLKKAKLMFFYTRYPSSNVLKTYFPDVKVISSSCVHQVKQVCLFFFSCVYRLVHVLLGRRNKQKKISSVSEERNKNAEGSNNKAAELLVCPGGRGRYRGHSLFKKSHSSQQME